MLAYNSALFLAYGVGLVVDKQKLTIFANRVKKQFGFSSMPEGISLVSLVFSGDSSSVVLSFDWLKDNSYLRGFLLVKEECAGLYDFLLVIENVDGFRCVSAISCFQRALSVDAESLGQFSLPILLSHACQSAEFSRLTQ